MLVRVNKDRGISRVENDMLALRGSTGVVNEEDVEEGGIPRRCCHKSDLLGQRHSNIQSP